MEIDKIKNISIRKRKNSQFCEKWCSGGWAWTRPAAVRVVRGTTSATREPLQHISVFGYSSILIIIIYRKNFIIITIILIVIVVGNRITIYYSEGIKKRKRRSSSWVKPTMQSSFPHGQKWKILKRFESLSMKISTLMSQSADHWTYLQIKAVSIGNF